MAYHHAQSQPDEGYSEETQDVMSNDMMTTNTTKSLSSAAQLVLQSLESLSQEDRLGILGCALESLSTEQQLTYFKDVLYSLPTWAKQDVSSHLDSLMFFDPVRYFPYEIVQHIFAHLTPKDLLSASAVSREWRVHTQDEELWKYCFKREGWQVDETKVRQVEQAARERLINHHDTAGWKRRDSRKRRLEEAFNDPAPPLLTDSLDDLMEGIEASPRTSLSQRSPTSRGKERRHESVSSVDSFEDALPEVPFRLKPSILQTKMGAAEYPKVSWAYIYKQRRLLERNWDQGNYQMFRLPHPKYESEGHAECVYTIQHIGSTLVSGSRDRTIRRWDLETCRLKGAPLYGHDASVLCLQFDPSPEHDIIVSGGSDSWVIIWRFSTGEILKKMTTAHTESVLNLRFDDRFIVTCSKDKTIKIWNRRAVSALDPMLPEHILPQFTSPQAGDMIAEFTLIAKLCGHQAAVNAVMIHGDRIVSASGDRAIKAWSIKTGRCEKTYTGHAKGIACVQYDGRRIVSGSSDNTVRIFDAEQQAEVACLHGHGNLVRTVQARFGDLQVTTDQELHAEARQADMKWSRAMALGAQPASGSRRSRRNPGTSRPEEMLTVGAKVPPGGGGTKWSRIISGSYDETVIIWKKDQDGKWTARHTLHQEMLSRHRLRIARPPAAPGTALPGAFPPQNVLNAPTPPRLTTTTTTTTTTTDLPSQQSFTTQATAGSNVADPDTPQQHPLPQRAPMIPAQHAPFMQQPQRESNRVFKLQFDVRRIVCCSQNKVIVGWDFAAGNEELARVGTWCEETY